MKLKNIYENEDFIIYEDNKGYDFKYTIENKTNKKIIINFNNFNDYIEIDKNNWVGLFNNEEYFIQEILEENYEVA